MALATRCPYCHTTFRVVHDQLKLRSGMVRCGQCQHIFNGIEHLIRANEPAVSPAAPPIPESAPPAPPAPALPEIVQPTPTEPESVAPALESAPHEPTVPHQHVDERLHAPVHPDAPPPPPPHHGAHAHEVGLRVEPTLDDEPWLEGRSHTLEVTRALENLAQSSVGEARPDTHPLHQPDAPHPHTAHTTAEAIEAMEADAPAAQEPDEPGFVKAARKQQKWRGFWLWLRAIGVLLLTVVLLAQTIYAWRDLIAIRWPITKAPMLEACAWLHCKIDLPTQIQQLSIELGELQSLPRNKNTFSYNTLLRNHSNLPQSWPHIELVLLDNSDKVIARRVFSPKDYQITAQERSKGFAAQSERAVRLYFETAPQLKALGYRAEIFYP